MSNCHRSPAYSAEPYGYGHPHNSVAGLNIIQYRSYQRDISIFHLRTLLLPLRVVREVLQSQAEYQDRLTGYDPLQYSDIVDGDEVSSGCIEAAYLPNILRGRGSALALRAGGDPQSEAVEWYLFSGPIDESFLFQFVCIDGMWSLLPETNPDDPRRCFDLVGYAEKGLKTRTVRGANREHKGWHDALCASSSVQKKVKLTWKKYGNELRANQEQTSRERTASLKDQVQDEDGDTAMRDGDVPPPQPPQKPVARRKTTSQVPKHHALEG